MQTNDKTDASNTQNKWTAKKGHKTSETAIEMKPQFNVDLINSSKTSPNKSSINSTKTGDKKSTNSVQNNTQTNKRSKGPFVSQLHNFKARLNLNASAHHNPHHNAHHKSISSLRPSHVFAIGGNDSAINRSVQPNGSQTGSSHVCANRSAQLADRLTATDGRLRAHDKCCDHSLVQHSFISDITDVRQMENTLLTLLEDFHSGKLQAFGQDITFEKMESVREQQERLARLHFELNLQQEIYGHQTEEGKRLAKDNMTKLIENLQQLSNSIEQLQSGSSVTNAHS